MYVNNFVLFPMRSDMYLASVSVCALLWNSIFRFSSTLKIVKTNKRNRMASKYFLLRSRILFSTPKWEKEERASPVTIDIDHKRTMTFFVAFNVLSRHLMQCYFILYNVYVYRIISINTRRKNEQKAAKCNCCFISICFRRLLIRLLRLFLLYIR